MMSDLIRDLVDAVTGVDLTKCSADYLSNLLSIVGREYVADREMNKKTFEEMNFEPTNIPYEEEERYRKCKNCKHSKTDVHRYPCSVCKKHDKWEAVENGSKI